MEQRMLLAAAAVLALGLNARADTIILKDGGRYTGRFVSGSESTITFQVERGMRRNFKTSEIQSLEFDNSGQENSGRDSSGRDRSATSSAVPRGGQRATGMRSDQASGTAGVIPAGTDLQVRTSQTIDTTSASEGQAFPATVEKNVMGDNGQVLVPRGSQAELIVRNASTGGTTGSGDLVLDVQSLAVNGQRYLVDSSSVTQSNKQGIGKNKRTGEYVGGGAVLGTVLGAIAGGGKGAAIGAIAGGAAGAGAKVLTRGKEVKVPAETVLTFQLQQPVRLVAR